MDWTPRLPLFALATVLWMGAAAVAAENPAGETLAIFESAITAAQVRPHIEYLASEELRGRSGKEARQAAAYIVGQFRQWGIQPLFANGSYYQDIPGSADEDGNTTLLGRNIGAWLPGSDPKLRNEIVIVSAHYDHLGVRNGRIFAGADDNASGVSMMLEVARQLATSKNRPRRSIVFVGFDLEEHMLWGSRWFAAHAPWPLEQVKLFITADMIGRSLGNLPLPAVFVLGSEHAPELKRVLDQVGQPRGLEVARLGIDLIGTRSDYGPFRDRQVPFLFFSTGEHPDYHTPRDLPEKIDFDKVAHVSGLVLKVTRTVANTDSAPVWTDDTRGNLDEVRALERITQLLLDAEKQRPLSDVQRYMVTNVRSRSRQILDKGEITSSDRTWLIRMSQVLLFSVF